MSVRSGISSLGCLAFTMLAAVASAYAQAVALNPAGKAQKAQAQADASEHPPGSYAGVKPGGAAPPGTLAKPGSRPVEITWPGFQMQPDGSSRVFLQTTVPLDARPTMAGNKVIVDLGDAVIVGANRFPLYTQFFNTPVTRVEIKRARKHKTLEITLRAPVEPRVSNQQASSGFHFLYLDFPAGDYVPKTAAAQSSAAPLPPPQPEGADYGNPPSHLEGSASASTAMDAELPPGMAKPKAKAKAKTKAKASGTLKIGM